VKERKEKKERDKMKGIRGYLKMPPSFVTVVSNDTIQ